MESNPEIVKKRLSLKFKLIVLLILLLGIITVAFYFYFQTTRQLRISYTQGIQHLETLKSEQERCADLISQESGKFDDYEYCRQLLQVFTKGNNDEKNI